MVPAVSHAEGIAMPDQSRSDSSGGDPVPASEVYDALYYERGCGPTAYGRDRRWLDFFADVAERIATDIEPQTVLDVGCAMGLLVEALRERGIEAWGIDVSEYAISRVAPVAAPYCRVASALEPLDERFDLITCIEVLEHLPSAQAGRAVGVLCEHSDDVLFSSSPVDHTEPTHVNVQPPEHWAAAFARHGFFRDADFDASFISPWAVRFKRHEGPITPIVAAYERRLWWLSNDNVAKREALADAGRALAATEATAAAAATERDEFAAAADALRREADELRRSVEGYRRVWGWLMEGRLGAVLGRLGRLWSWRRPPSGT